MEPQVVPDAVTGTWYEIPSRPNTRTSDTTVPERIPPKNVVVVTSMAIKKPHTRDK